MKILNQDVTVKFMSYGQITVPAGTPVTSITAMGFDPNYNFVNAYGWIDTNYASIARILKHDAIYHGIDIPKEYLIEK